MLPRGPINPSPQASRFTRICIQEIGAAIDQKGLTHNVARLLAGEKDYRCGALIDGALPGNGDGLDAGAFTSEISYPGVPTPS